MALFPPHPRVDSETRSSTLIPTRCLRVSSIFFRVVNIVPNNPKPGNRKAAAGYPPTGGVEAAETVNVEDDVLDPGEIVEGLREQVKPVGAEQASEI